MKSKDAGDGRSFRPVDPLKSPRFGSIATFNRLPYVSDLVGKKVDVAILGIPFDGGTTFRPGARFGPRAVRDASVLCRNYNAALGVSVYENLNVIDGGDIDVNPIQIQKTFENIETHIERIHQEGAMAVCVGGDHSILLPDLRAVYKKFGKITLVHFDAHNDTGDTAWGEKYHHGTPIRRAIEEEILVGKSVFQIGIRGPLASRSQDDYIREQGINVLDIDAFHEPALRDSFFNKLRMDAGTGPCYLTFDVDGVDPAFAPGTGTPVVGGLSSFEAIQSVRRLKGLNFIGGNVVEISPPYDHGDITALLGAAIVFEILSLMAVANQVGKGKGSKS